MNVTMVDEEVHSVITKPEPFIHTRPLSPLNRVFKTPRRYTVIGVIDVARGSRLRAFCLFIIPSKSRGVFLSSNWFPLKRVKWLPLMANSFAVQGIVIAKPGVRATTWVHHPLDRNVKEYQGSDGCN
ncbi:hypothetical protein Tco_0627649 [Tanacetum coccineum]|uniref:Uncharacterized protein n=1 Tax=Tanacetum coccineum TaxID=301880 RepID=A0ABQ4WMZ9_9ASTR